MTYSGSSITSVSANVWPRHEGVKFVSHAEDKHPEPSVVLREEPPKK